MKLAMAVFLAVSMSTPLLAADKNSRAAALARKYPELPANVDRRSIVIWSDGTKMAGDLYSPKEIKKEDRLPAIVFVAGTGGTKKGSATRMAPLFVEKGFVFLAFDYRGWGESESKLLMLEPMPEPNEAGEITVKARAMRWQMDFADQCADIRAAVAYVSGESNVDPTRIGVIGTSYGGGLATWTAANDPRVKCVAVQVPGMGGGKKPAADRRAYEMLTRQARGETEPVPFELGAPVGKMATYAHMRYNTAKGLGFDVMEAAERIKVPMLIIDAEKEELMNIAENGGRVAEILKTNKVDVEYHVIPGIGHYGVYSGKFGEVTDLEIAWFERRLKAFGGDKPGNGDAR